MNIPKAPAYTMGLKDALVFAGLLDKNKAGRGRPSKEMTENGEMLVRDHGYLIKGLSVSTSTAPVSQNATEPTAPVRVEKVVRSDPNAVLNVPDELRSENEWQAWTADNGKIVEVGMRTVCNGCGASLSYCPCRTPRVWLDYNREGMVNFKGRTSPLPTKRW